MARRSEAGLPALFIGAPVVQDPENGSGMTCARMHLSARLKPWGFMPANFDTASLDDDDAKTPGLWAYLKTFLFELTFHCTTTGGAVPQLSYAVASFKDAMAINTTPMKMRSIQCTMAFRDQRDSVADGIHAATLTYHVTVAADLKIGDSRLGSEELGLADYDSAVRNYMHTLIQYEKEPGHGEKPVPQSASRMGEGIVTQVSNLSMNPSWNCILKVCERL